MRIIHIPFSYYPEEVGGTEVYVSALVKRLLAKGVEAVVAAPGKKTESYVHDGIKVYRLAADRDLGDMRDFYGAGSKKVASEFGLLLDKIKPGIVHLHAFTYAVSWRLVQLAKKRGAKVFFTYHTPTVSCQQGSLIRWGEKVCDGKLRNHLCSGCTLHGLGLSKIAAFLVGSLPASIGNIILKSGLKGGLWTALSMTALMKSRHKAIRDLMADADGIVAVSEWVKTVLINVGVPPHKIFFSRQGLCQTRTESLENRTVTQGAFETFTKCIFLGRFHWTKGIHMLIDAFSRAPRLKIHLDIYGIPYDEAGISFMKKMKNLAKNDPRITFKDLIPSEQVPEMLKNYDFLLAPSLFLETGPLVVLEAFSAGVPVVGPNRGSFPEIISDGINGLLIEPNSVEAWVNVFEKLANDPALSSRLRAGIRPPRTMDTVADEMMHLYQRSNDKAPNR